MCCFFACCVEQFLSSCCSIGEDALANLSIERTENGTVTGHIRIRSKTQGIALSLGDRITMGELILSTGKI